jgi:hypothetical protein
MKYSGLLAVAAMLAAVNFASHQALAVTLGVSGDSFTLNGSRAFLLGASYFDADHWHASDLDQLAAHRFNLIRVWVDWANERGNGLLDADGNLVKKQTLLDLVRAADQRNIVVDVTITQPDAVYGTDFSKRLASVRATAQALRNEPNVLYDVMNEHDVKRGATVSHTQVRQLVDAARQADPDAVITVSSGGRHIVNNMTLVRRNVDEELAAGVAVMTPHLTRTSDWYSKTGQRVAALRSYLLSKGRSIPVYLQEEQRTGWHNAVVTKAQFVEAVEQAVEAGAAGWVLHTDAGFDLEAGTFMSRLDSDERAAAAALADAVVAAGGSLPSSRPGGLNSGSGTTTSGTIREHDSDVSTSLGRPIKTGWLSPTTRR